MGRSTDPAQGGHPVTGAFPGLTREKEEVEAVERGRSLVGAPAPIVPRTQMASVASPRQLPGWHRSFSTVSLVPPGVAAAGLLRTRCPPGGTAPLRPLRRDDPLMPGPLRGGRGPARSRIAPGAPSIEPFRASPACTRGSSRTQSTKRKTRREEEGTMAGAGRLLRRRRRGSGGSAITLQGADMTGAR